MVVILRYKIEIRFTEMNRVDKKNGDLVPYLK